MPGGVRQFPEATEPGTIRYACAESKQALERFFAREGLEYRPKLVRKGSGDGFCHIHYEPTIRGFRAATQYPPIQELFTEVDPLSFVVGRKPVGDSLDAARMVLQNLPRPISLTLGINGRFDRRHWPAATVQHFLGTHHRITLEQVSGTTVYCWWQDLMQPGYVNGRDLILVPRRVYQGREDYSEVIQPMLDTFQDARYVRSKLSWEGGDLQIARDPKHPGQRILFYGESTRNYWGKDLPKGEFEYVLRAEFGAERVVDLSKFGMHADYLVSFLPAHNTVLLAEPVSKSRSLI